MFRGLLLYSVMLSPYFRFSGALASSGFLLLYSMIVVALYNT